MNNRLLLMAPRINAVKNGIRRLEAEQRAQGLGLRGDMKAALSRLELYMDQAEQAIRNGDAAEAKSNLEKAERDLGRLESFLNY